MTAYDNDAYGLHPEETLRQQLACDELCQQWLGALSMQDAAERIYLFQLPDPADKEVYTDEEWDRFMRSHILIAPAAEDGWILDRIASETQSPYGTMQVHFSRALKSIEQHESRTALVSMTRDVRLILMSFGTAIDGLRQYAVSGPYRQQSMEMDYGSQWLTVTAAIAWGYTGV